LGGGERQDPGALAARAHLAASAALAVRRSSEPLGVHELNGLYRDRAGVTPDANELRHLLRTVVANVGAANAPGWYWLRGLGGTEVRARIAALAAGDGEAKVVKEAIALLTSSPTPPKPGELRTIVESALGAKEGEATAALGLLARHGTRRDLTALAGALDSHPDTEGVATARLTIRSCEIPPSALRT
jgi:hypothetical protein